VEWHSWCDCRWVRRWNGIRFLPPSLSSTRPAVLAFPPAAAVCASAVNEVALNVRVLPKAPLKMCLTSPPSPGEDEDEDGGEDGGD